MADANHYLKDELYALIKKDSAIFDFLQAGSLDGLWYWDLKKPEHEWMNPRFWEILGFDPAEMKHLASEWQDLINPDDLQMALENFQKHCADPGYPYDQVVRYRHRNGSTVWVRCRGTVIRDTDGTPIRMLGAHTDLTAQKNVEYKLRINESKLRSTIEESRSGYFSIDKNGIILDVNNAWVKMYKYSSREEIIGQHFAVIQKTDDIEAANEFVKAIMEGRPEYLTGEFSRKCKDDSIGYHTFTAQPVKENGQVIGIEGFIQDSTARKIAEENLQKSEQQYSTLFESMSEMAVMHELIYDAEGAPVDYRILDCNPAFSSITGITRATAVNQPASRVYGTATPPYLEKYARVAITGEPCQFESDFEPMNKTFAISVFSPGKDKFATISTDITDRRKYETTLQNIQKLESLGTLAGGIAHDFNNLLGGVFGNIDLAKAALTDGKDASGYLDQGLAALDRAKDLTRQLLTFSKGGAPRKSSIAVTPLIKEACALALSGSNTECRTQISEDICTVDADPNQLSQVINNVLLNARQAMPDGGTVALSAGNIRLTKDTVPGLAPGKYIWITIKDEGPGIPEAQQQKVFDPFYSTKPAGSGLGLTTCHSIMQKHNGMITVDSQPGAGTSASIYIPVSTVIPGQIAAAGPKHPQMRGRVLIMDDEQVICDVAQAMLKLIGFDVVCAGNGKQALEIFAKELEAGRRFDIALLDLTVPGDINGTQTIAEIHRLDPDVLGIVSSGYSDNPELSNPERYGFAGKLEKPFRKEALENIVLKTLKLKKMN